MCGECGHIGYEVVEATGHNYIGTITKEATCAEEGEITYVCAHCGDTITETIEMTAHNYVKKYASKMWLQWLVERLLNIFFGYEGTQGYYYECDDCRHIMTGSESMTVGTASVESNSCSHTNLGGYELIFAAACEDQGVYGQYCLDCGELINTYTVDSLGGHVYGETLTFDATCTENGYTYHICNECGEIEKLSTIPATGHTASEAVTENYVAATCATNGSYDLVVYCSVCGEEISRETITIPATGHTYGTPVWSWADDYSSATATFTCVSCGERQTVTATVESKVTKEATTSEKGIRTYTATVTFNGKTYTDTQTEEIEMIKSKSGCGSVIGSDGGGGDLMMISLTLLLLCGCYVVLRCRKRKA